MRCHVTQDAIVFWWDYANQDLDDRLFTTLVKIVIVFSNVLPPDVFRVGECFPSYRFITTSDNLEVFRPWREFLETFKHGD